MSDIDIKQVADAVAEGNKAFETFKAKNDELIAEVKGGFDDVVRREELDRINTALDQAQETNEKMDDEDKTSHIRSKLLDRHPHVKEFVDHPDSEILCIKVTSFLLLDGLTDAHFQKIN